MSQPATPIEAAADALLRVIVKADRQRFALKLAAFRSRPFMDAGQPGATDALDAPGLAADPIGTACRAELRRIGHALHAANPHADFTALSVEIAEIDPSHADWRAMALETAWAGIGRAQA
ncbi:hypothetical protein MKK63_11095 [Methylobacterium sp. J-088]|uniref:hypothetical protein n=1 Tax=Methylobacterium sp. J-088 TaxID=2836664 RepID=UPI001FB89B0B|nr:hypothetical protein [Methylobacterium sp. J-088]MCJ2063256.1 hypothetical protein [Methylobacterium sp. J-088]